MAPNDDIQSTTRAAVADAINSSGKGDTELARALGVSRGTIAGYRKADHTIPLDVAIALARVFRMPLERLAGTEQATPERATVKALARQIELIAETQIERGQHLRTAAQLLFGHAGEVTALGAGDAVTREARAALAEGEEVALAAEGAAQLGREKDDPTQRQSA